MAIIFVILGAAPFVLGYYIPIWTAAGKLNMSDQMIAVLFLIAWFVLAFLLGLLFRRAAQVAGGLCFIGFIDLVVIGFEVLLFNKMFDGEVGNFSQMYYVPSIAAGKAVSSLVPVEQNYFYQVCGSFVLMLVVALIGALIGMLLRGKKKAKKKEAAAREQAEHDAEVIAAATAAARGKEAAAEKAEEVSAAAEEKFAEAAQAAGETVEEFKEAAGEIAGDAAEAIN